MCVIFDQDHPNGPLLGLLNVRLQVVPVLPPCFHVLGAPEHSLNDAPG